MEQVRKDDGVLSRTSRKRMTLRDLVRCIWMEESVCIIVEKEIRKTGPTSLYRIYLVYDFLTGEEYWVDEEDLEKL